MSRDQPSVLDTNFSNSSSISLNALHFDTPEQPESPSSSPSPSSAAAEQLRHQGRLLLVSLLENFCSLYDRNPQKNQRLFLSLCRKLSAMGILHSADFVDETVHVRAVYKRAFRDLVMEAIQGIRAMEGAATSTPRLLTDASTLIPEDDDSEAEEEAEEVTSLTAWSRYTDDFEELALLGKGGYGQVYQARNRIDDRFYAIKKIKFASVASQRFQRILREVKSLAHLDHPHIVRYHSAWIEECPQAKQGDESDTLSENDDLTSNDTNEDGVLPLSPIGFQPALMMYIQMELCHMTLSDWLEQRNALIGGITSGTTNVMPPGMTARMTSDRHEVCAVEARRILKAIVKALQYIHSRGMIHRDVKPQNIFFVLGPDHELIPKLGDFGLVIEQQSPNSSRLVLPMSPNSTSNFSHPSRTAGVGTELYSSPEQARGDLDYGERSDIYSLGIICFELFHPMATQMERIRCLTDLRQSKKMPEELVRKWPKEAALIWSCLSVDPLHRPSAADILDSGVLDAIDESHCIEVTLRNENALLKEQLEVEREERKRLQELVEKQGLLLEQLSLRMGQLEQELLDLST